jgi:hypothetical protein
MKKIIAALAITAVFASCKKEKITNTAPAVDKKLTHIAYTQDGITENEDITYDAKGRVLTYTNENEINSFSYENDTRLVVTTRKKADNTLKYTKECTLNAKGAITQMLYKDPAGALTYTYEYTYNADNQMIRAKGFGPLGGNFERIGEIVNGNIASVKTYYDGVLGSTTVYYFDGAKSNNLPHQLAGPWPSSILFGRSNSHLMTELRTTDTLGELTWHVKATYVLDADGYVSSLTTKYMLDGVIGVTTYQYQ